MGKERFTINPFPALELSDAEKNQLLELGRTIIEANFERDEAFFKVGRKVDHRRWKLSKERERMLVHTERPEYKEPTVDEPFNSVVVKWMEMDIPLRRTGVVQNRDYVYLECTGFVHMANGDRAGYHFLHSIDFPQIPKLSNRVRGDLSICGFFRQVGPNVIDVCKTGLMDPAGDMIRMLAVPVMTEAFLSPLRYVHCGQMRKLTWKMEKAHAEARLHGAPNPGSACVTCGKPSTGWTLGKSATTCKSCFRALCSGCKIKKKISLVTADLTLSERKINFCTACLANASISSAAEIASYQIMENGRKSGVIPITIMGTKRKRDAVATDAMPDEAARELHRLIIVVLKTLQLPADVFESVEASESKVSDRIQSLGLCKLKRMPRKVGVLTVHVKSESTRNEVLTVESPRKLADLCVDAFKLELSRGSYRHVVRVWLPEEEDIALGAIPDRILVQTREFAEYSSSDAVEKALTAQLPLKILFRDDAIIVVDKPANVLSVDGTDPHASVSVHRCIASVYPEARMVHRLDQETSGLLVIALTKSAAQSLNAQFRDRSVNKTLGQLMLVEMKLGEIESLRR
ncbi:hypothetical protein JG687_00011574 [Phytophthora cactorum]|uniref:Pseudouridine synthase RsuA/RluA-like domain-containing protein n=1 Tax=Phytophthora cactorum TaxID=29920 RepID=A0A8T1U637_9STRA|nr:hypothetical protein JG687_00011574 [Phytophthora cactorum]